MERMELDRPILQREKFEMIFLEKIGKNEEKSKNGSKNKVLKK